MNYSKSFHTLLLAAMSGCMMLVASCSGGVESTQARAEGAPADSAIFMMGADAGRQLLELRTVAEVETELIDVNARIYNIECRVGKQAAADYEHGFRSYIKAHNDTLARILFD